MNILLTGATGYIGKRLLPELIKKEHHVTCLVRDKSRFHPPESTKNQVSVVEGDLLDLESLTEIPEEIDAAYYLVHSMSTSDKYSELEKKCAINFRKRMSETNVRQVIYLSGMVNEEELSEHLKSRQTVEFEIKEGTYHFTCLRAGIIIGSGSASFEIMRDLVEKLPFMITPKWLKTRCQPIGISDVLKMLTGVLNNKETFDQNFDIGCDDILTYKEMLLGLAKIRNLKRTIWTVPVMTPRLSSYWLYFVTSTSYKLAKSLVDSMKVEVICRDTRINQILKVQPISYEDSLRRAFRKIESNEVVSSWKDAFSSSDYDLNISEFIQIPTHGCFRDVRQKSCANKTSTLDRIWRIGGKTGWYYGNWMWHIRGFLDKLVGGVGLRRGRTHEDEINAGDALDFWRVLYANKDEGRLLLYAEMKLPGEAWLEFKMENDQLIQRAVFRPKGLLGRLYWYSVLPFHGFIFKGMIRNLTRA